MAVVRKPVVVLVREAAEVMQVSTSTDS